MPRHHQLHFYDAAESRNVPSGVLAAVYVDHGSFQWSQSEVDRMRGVFGVSESGDPEAALFARCMAIEPGAGNANQIGPFLHVRRHHHHDDGIGYVNESDWEATERAAIDAGFDPDWWVASPGNPHPQELRSPVRGKQPVAVQNVWTNAYDLSMVLGRLPFTAPHHFRATG